MLLAAQPNSAIMTLPTSSWLLPSRISPAARVRNFSTLGEEVGFGGDGSVARNDGIEIQLHGRIQRLGPLHHAAAAGVVDQRCGASHQVAGVEGLHHGPAGYAIH